MGDPVRNAQVKCTRINGTGPHPAEIYPYSSSPLGLGEEEVGVVVVTPIANLIPITNWDSPRTRAQQTQMPNANTPNQTDDEWLTNQKYPLKTNGWFDGQEPTC